MRFPGLMSIDISDASVEELVAVLSQEYPGRTPIQITTAVLDAIDESDARTHTVDRALVTRSARVRLGVATPV
jgi:hypothetical protein